MFEFISANVDSITLLISLVISVSAGLLGFIKWLDTRKQTLKNDRFEKYTKLIELLSGSSNGAPPPPPLQIASAWLLLEYKEHYEITLKILDSNVWEISNNNMKKYIVPEMKKVRDLIVLHLQN